MKQLLEAAHFAAQKHSKQRRKNLDASPYVNHLIEVAMHLSRVGCIDDEDILIAALLHDTIEDTQTTKEEIVAEFGEKVANLVLECTDDRGLEKMERKRMQIVSASEKSQGAKMITISDETCNLRSILADPPRDWSLDRQKEYFMWAEQVVSGLLGVNKALDDCVQSVLQEGLQKLAKAEQDGGGNA